MNPPIFLFFVAAALGSSFLSEDRVWDLPTPPLAFGLQTFETNGTLVVPTPSHACSPLTKNLTGLVALVDSDRCPPFAKVENCLDAGAIAVVLRGYRDTFGLLFFYRGSGQTDVSVPVVELWGGLKPPDDPVGGENVTLVPASNPIAEFGEGPWMFYTIFLSMYVAVTLYLAGRKFYEFRRVGEYDVLPSLTMGLIFVTCLIRIPILVDPSGTHGIYNWGTVEAFLTLDFSFAVVAALVVAFHWNALVRKIEKKDESHSRLKVVGFSISALLLIAEIVTSVMRGLYLPAMPFLMGKVILYALMGFGIGGYFFRSGFKVVRMAAGGKAKIPESLKRRAYYGLGVAVCLILFPITALLVITPLYHPPGGYFALRFFASFWLNTATLLLIFIFDARKNAVGDGKSDWVNTAEMKTSAELELSEEDSESSSS